jgi:protocatechuate 3,4-dioxygenase beta subunit
LGNLVWEDYNNDGVADDGEPGIEGVTVELLDENGDVVETTTTDSDGHYEFTGLEAGDYQVNIPADQTVLEGLNTSGTPNGADDETDNDNNGVASADDFTSGVIELGEGTGNEEPTAETLRDDDATLDEDGALRDDRSELTVDFGFYRGLRLGNQVFLDGEQGDPGYNNGVFDAGETGISGVTVELWEDDGDGVFNPDDDTLVDTTATDSEGNYSFGNLDDATPYFVAVEDVGTGYSSSGQSADPIAADNADDGAPGSDYASVSNPITLTIEGATTGEVDTVPTGDDAADVEADAAGDDYPDNNSEMTVDFGFVDVPLYRIGNLVWEDLDNDGIAEDGESGINGVTVNLLDENGDIIATTVTAASPGGQDGWYEFPNLMAGDYQVSIPMDQAVLEGKGSSDNNEELLPNDDGDNNDNGLIDGDAWTSGVVSVGDPALTDPADFGTEPADETLRDAVATDDDDNGGFYTDDRSNYSVDFGFLDIPKYEIGNLVWVDSNDDGVADDGEPGIGGVELELLDEDGDVVQTTTTDPDGSYLFTDLDAGSYQVTIPADQTGQTIDDGTDKPVDLQDLLPSAINVADPDEPTDVDNDSNGVEAPDGTITAGFVTVGDDGTGTLDELNPAEPTDETDRDGTTDIDPNDDVEDAKQNATVDFGFAEPLRIGNQVFLDDGGEAAGNYDANNQDNGIADDNESGVEGVLVQLLDENGDVIAETVTDANGNYYFDDLRQGDYQVGIPADQEPELGDQPDIIDGATDGLQSSNGQSTTAETSDDDDDGDPAGDFLTVSDTVTLDHGTEATDEAGDLNDPTDEAAETAANAATSNHDDDDSNLEVDLGLTPIPTYRIGSLVWEDFDNDGIAETGEPGIEGVLVQLVDENGDVIAETVTDSDGEYVFDDLPAGDYQVVLPADQEPELGDQPDIIADVLDGLNTSGTPEAAADNDVDNDNNGVDTAEGLTSGVITLGEGDTKDEPTGEVDRVDSATSDEDGTIRDDRSNQTVDFGLFRGLRLGNQVFLDGEQGEPGYNNGVFDTGETGISGVTVELWEDDGDGVFDPETDTLISTTPTDSEGNYSFGNVEPDTPYFIAIEEIGIGYSSSGQSDDVVAADNVDDAGPSAGYDAVTSVITLAEPSVEETTTGETDTNPTGDEAADEEADAATGEFYPDGNSEMTVDLGFVEVPLYQIGNLVWEDIDNDGVAEDGEPGINGVTVNLLDDNGDIVATTTTSTDPDTGADGWYEFPNLMAGDYQVSIPMDQAVLDDMGSSDNNEELSPNDDGDNNDNGLIDGDAWTSGVVSVGDPTLTDPADFGTEPADETQRSDDATDSDDNGGFYTDDRSNYSVDFGFLDIPKYEIGNLVWVDSNDDGVADDGEPGIGGVELELLDEDGDVVQTTTTDPDGSYLFTDLDAGSYQVTIPADQTGQTIDDGADTPVNLSDLLPGAVVASDPDSPADVDNDNNGVEEPDGTITAGFVTVGDDGTGTLDELNPAEPTDETDRDGTTDIDPNDDVEDAKQNATVDFGFVEPLRVGSLVWLDDGGESTGDYDAPTEDDGIADANEVGIEGVLVQLLDENGDVIAETVTDANGNYYFEDLRQGDYQVGIPADQEPELGDQPDIIPGALDTVRSSTGQSTTPETSDDDDDGNPDDANGWASLSEPFGLERTDEAVNEAGDLNDPTVDGAEDTANAVTGPHNDDNSNLEVDFGFSPLPTYRIGDLVWEDYDDDGIAEAGEPGIEGILVQLLDENGDVVAETVTDSEGNYAFTELEPGDYQVHIPADQTPDLDEPQPGIIPGVLDGLQSSGTPNGADDESNNDNNGVPAGPGAGVDITSGVIELGEGTGNEEPTDEETRSDDSTPVEDGTLRDDRSELTVDIGLFRGLRLGNQVFLDGEQGEPGYNNGVFDTGETGISGVTVELWEDDGDGVFDPAVDTLIDTTVTDSEGNYVFGNLEPETPYFVAVEDIGIGSATETVSSDPTAADNDNDGAPAAGYDSVSDAITLTIGGATTDEADTVPSGDDSSDPEADTAGDDYPDANSEMTVDLGFIDLPLYRIGNLVWEDLDNDGIAESGEPGIEGVTVQLLDANGNLVDEVVTDADGSYEFLNLMAGEYQVSIPMDQPALDGFASSNEGDETDPNADVDNNDNGLDGSDAWVSGPVQLGPDPLVIPFGSEPTDETVRADDPTDDDEAGGFFTDERSNHSVDFGFYQLTLGSQVWIDTNADGVLDPTEQPVDGVPVNLYQLADDGSLIQVDDTTTSTINGEPGSYLFTGLESGATYVVEIPTEAFAEGAPLEYLYSTPDPVSGAPDPDDDPTNGDDNGVAAPAGDPIRSLPVTLVTGDEPTGEPSLASGAQDGNENLTVDFGVTALSLGGTIWEDTTEDGVLAGSTEPVVAGVPVELWAVNPATGEVLGDTPTAVTTTATDGTYLFDGLVPGDYIVRVPVDAMSASGPLAGMTSSVGNGVTPPDPDDSTDGDDNGVLTIDGWVQTSPVSLDYGDEPIGEPETGSAGDASDNHTVDLGFVPAPPMAVGNRVWEDLNEDGIQDPDEDGIEDVVLELIDVATGEVVATTMTDENGFYLFGDLLPGTYVVQVAASNMVGQGELAAHKSSDAYDETDPDVDPSDDDDQGIESNGIVASAPFTLTPTFEPIGETDCDCPDGAAVDMNTNLTVDFGFYPAGVDVRPTPETISGAIFLDVASTGGFSTQSTPIEGVKLTITLAGTGEVIGEVVTDENGFWSQIALVPGEYEVRIDDSNFEGDGVLVGLSLLDETERTIMITAGDEPDTSAFGNDVDERLGLAMPAEPDRDVPTEPLAFTGGDRQKQLAVVATMFLVLGMLTLWASRRREEHELDN